MKWGRKKSALPSSSSSPISSITRVFPASWFSKLKQKGGNFESKSKQRCAFEFPTPKSSGWREGRFYSMDEDDSFWRLSFGDERIQGRRSTGGINPLWYDSDHEFQVPVSGFKSFESTKMEVSRREEYRNFSEMLSDIKMMKERRGKQRIVADNGAFEGRTRGNGEARNSTRRRKDVNDQKSRKSRGFDDGEEKISNSRERDIFPIEPEAGICIKDDSKSRKHHKSPIIDQCSVSEWLDFEGRKLKEIKIKTESKKKAANINRGIKSYSPRTECKIRALEEMKKARTKSKKKERKEKVLEGNAVFDSFAVVKSSYNPQQDFRDSMIEMIREKGIEHPQDLEELLACYLTLNCDEYHDLIIRVFRQVWFELKGVYIDPPIRNGEYFDY